MIKCESPRDDSNESHLAISRKEGESREQQLVKIDGSKIVLGVY